MNGVRVELDEASEVFTLTMGNVRLTWNKLIFVKYKLAILSNEMQNKLTFLTILRKHFTASYECLLTYFSRLQIYEACLSVSDNLSIEFFNKVFIQSKEDLQYKINELLITKMDVYDD